MLMFAMLLQSVIAENPLPRLLGPLTAECVDEHGCPVEGARRFRLESEPAPVDDVMTRAMQGVWKPCETTGAPKCPAKGRLVFRTEFGG